LPGWSAQLRERRVRERKTVGFPFTKKQKDQRTGLFVFVWVSGTISCMLTQLSPVRPVRRGVLGSVPSFGLLFILVAVRVPRTGERQVRRAPGCTGEWWMHGAKTLSFAARSSESKEGKGIKYSVLRIRYRKRHLGYGYLIPNTEYLIPFPSLLGRPVM